MYRRILIPIDLSHADKLDKALDAGADLAKRHGAQVTYVGVASDAPGSGGARTPEDFAQKMKDFATAQAEKHGIDATGTAIFCNDPAVELNDALLAAIKDTGSDLVVMASHVPGVPEHFFGSHGGATASHAKVSVFVVR